MVIFRLIACRYLESCQLPRYYRRQRNFIHIDISAHSEILESSRADQHTGLECAHRFVVAFHRAPQLLADIRKVTSEVAGPFV